MKTCSFCSLEKEYYLFVKEKRNKDGIGNKCLSCKNEKRNLERAINPIKIRQKEKDYKSKNKDKVSEWRKKCVAKNPDLYKSHRKKYTEKNHSLILKRSKDCAIIAKNELKDSYIKSDLVKLGFKKEQITKELIELKRVIIKTKRLCKILMN